MILKRNTVPTKEKNKNINVGEDTSVARTEEGKRNEEKQGEESP